MSRLFLLQLIYAWCKIEWIELTKLFIIVPIFDRLWSHYSEFPFVEVDEQKLLTLRLPPALLLLLPLKKQVVVNNILTTISSLPSHCSKNLGAVHDLEISLLIPFFVNYGFVIARFLNTWESGSCRQVATPRTVKYVATIALGGWRVIWVNIFTGIIMTTKGKGSNIVS